MDRSDSCEETGFVIAFEKDIITFYIELLHGFVFSGIGTGYIYVHPCLNKARPEGDLFRDDKIPK